MMRRPATLAACAALVAGGGAALCWWRWRSKRSGSEEKSRQLFFLNFCGRLSVPPADAQTHAIPKDNPLSHHSKTNTKHARSARSSGTLSRSPSSSSALGGGGGGGGGAFSSAAADNDNHAAAATAPTVDLANEAMVWEMLYNSGYSLPTSEAEGTWRRALVAAAAAAGEPPPPPPPDADAAGAEGADGADGGDERPLTRDDAERLSPEQLSAALQRRARAVAERAFWDSVEWRVRTGAQRGGGLASQLAPMVHELAREAASLLLSSSPGAAGGAQQQQLQEEAARQARALTEKYGASEQRAAAALATAPVGGGGNGGGGGGGGGLPASVEQLGGASTSALLSALGDLSRAFALGATGGRAAAAAAAAADAERRLGAAVASAAAAAAGAGGSPAEAEAAVAAALAPALTAALRLLMAQSRLQRLDAANARLSALASAMRGGGAVGYLSGRLSEKLGLVVPAAAEAEAEGAEGAEGAAAAPAVAVAAARLPRTARWMREAHEAVIAAAVASASAASSEAAAAAAPSPPPSPSASSFSPPSSAVAALLAPPPPSSAAAALLAPLASAGLLAASRSPSPDSAAASMVPATLRAGLRRMPGASPSPPAANGSGNGGGGNGNGGGGGDAWRLRAAYPALPPSWRSAVRLGLLALVSGDAPASDPATLPEVLQLDRERLHEAQNALQRLLVLSGGMLVAAQLRAAEGAAAADAAGAAGSAAGAAGTWAVVALPPWTPAQAAAGRRRLAVVLADPSMRLADLVTDLTALANEGWAPAPAAEGAAAGGGGGEQGGAAGAPPSSRAAAAALQPPVSEARVRALFTSLVNPQSAGFRALRANLCAAAACALLHGPDSLLARPASSPALASLLQRAGASALAEDVAALAARLAAVAAAQEAVFGEVLEALASAPS